MIIALRGDEEIKGRQDGFHHPRRPLRPDQASLFAIAPIPPSHVQTDAMVVVEGEGAADDFSGGLRLRIKRVMSMEDARQPGQSLRLKVKTDALQR